MNIVVTVLILRFYHDCFYKADALLIKISMQVISLYQDVVSNQKMYEYIKVVSMRAGIQNFVETRITQGGVRNLSQRETLCKVTGA